MRLAPFAVCLAAAGLAACASAPTRPKPGQGLVAVDGAGRRLERAEVGSSLGLGLQGLRPRTVYEVRVGLDRPAASLREALSFARVTTDRRGNVPPFTAWYQSGVVGCSERARDRRLPPQRFRGFDEAERALAGRRLVVTLHAVEHDPGGRTPLLKLAVGAAEAQLTLPLEAPREPLLFASTAEGCLLNSAESATGDLYVSGRHFKPGEELSVAVVPNQRAWYVGDAVDDATGVSAAAAAERVKVGPDGRFTVRVWERALQRRGVYDLVARRGPADQLGRLRAADVVSYGSDTGFILYLRYPVGGPTMDIAGRPIGGSPYFQFADSFADANDNVWGAVDPTYVPAGHAGGTYAAYYVVPHRDVAGWSAATNLADQSGGAEIMPVKAGCVNGTDVVIWPAPTPPATLPPGAYDVVVDFGLNPAETEPAFSADDNYDASKDFLDGADQIGFVVAKDPYDLGPTPVGRASYSQDNFFGTLGGAGNVDLRAVVRYPATAAGDDTPVAAGQHPLFLIEHGNHAHCRVATDGTLWYDRLAQAMAGTITWAQLSALTHTHVSCPDRARNHEGYMRLLEILASRGVIAVSIDAYDLTGSVPGWIAERGDLILKHVELWSHMHDTTTFPSYPDFFSGRFAGHVDLSKISVSGHSRGGEASVAAYMRNLAAPAPFAIGSVSSIAPVDFNGYELPDVPYFVILPAADGDVSSLSGAPIYDRAGAGLPTPDGTTKSGIYVYGANHNFFNSVWAGDWDDWTDSHPTWPARPDFIPAADQQRLGEAYLAAFTLAHLKSEAVYEDMLRGGLVFPSTAGRKIYALRHEKLHSKLESGTTGGTPSGGATSLAVSNPSVHDTQARQVGWPAASAQLTYTVPLAQRDASAYEVLSFRAAQTNAATNPVSGGQDFQVELVGGGQTKATYASRFDPIPKPYDRVGADHNVMTTVRIPLHSFIMNNAGVTLDNVDTVRFKFTSPSAGEIHVDDIEFSR